MSTTVFDTLAYAKRLKAAGVPEAQAEAQAEALAEAITNQVATKQDILELRIEMRELKIDLIKWMVGIALVLGVMIISILVKLS